MRHFFTKLKEVIPLENLFAAQVESYERFRQEGLLEILEEVNPIEDTTGRGWQLSFQNPVFGEPKPTVEEAFHKGITYTSPWYLTAKLLNTKSGRSRSAKIYMGDLPMMTEVGTFVINGVERVVVNQLTRSEGVFFTADTDPATGKILSGAKLLPKNGAWLEFELARSGILTVRIDRKRKVAATALLRLFGLDTDEKIINAFADVDTGSPRIIETTLEKDPAKSKDAAILEIYRRLRPGEPLILDNARPVIASLFFDSRRYNLGKVGRFKLNQKLGLTFANEREFWTLKKKDLILTIKKIIEISNGIGEADDIDHLGNRRVRSVGELLQHQVRIGFLQMEQNIRSRMSLQPRGELPSPAVLISSRPVAARIHGFFASSQLSQFMSQHNPLDGLDHLRKLSVKGPGGLTRERASFSVRDAHYTHYGRICPVRTPEGPNVGLDTHLALYARVNEYGFLETPYRRLKETDDGRKQVTDEVVYLAAYDEDDYFITHALVTLDEDDCIIPERIALRHKGDFFVGATDQVQLMDISPKQIVGAAAALIPFLANDDVNRSLVGAAQESQAVPLLKPQAPLVGTGLEKIVAENSGVLITTKEAGTVDFVDAQKIVVKNKQGRKQTYPLKKFTKSNQETCYNQKAVVEVGQKVQSGDLLADGPACEGGELALGTNLKIAYMSWGGLTYEDAIVISDRLVRGDILSSIMISKHTVQVLETKLGPEEVTRDIPNVSEAALRNLDAEGVVVIGADVRAGDILVGKIAPKGETELTAEERLLRSIFGEKAREVRDNSLRMPHGEYGTVIGVKVLTREETEELPAGVLSEIQVLVAQNRKIMVGDKLAGRHGNKGVISKIVSQEDMPYLPDGTPIDIIISPASVVSRMNVGQLLETHLGGAAEKMGKKYAVPPFTKIDESLLIEELKEAGLPANGKERLIDGRNGEYFDQEVVVGNAYILKLIHLVEDKVHARSTGPYSLITQQPLGGKAQFGGQRLGEMEVWALEAYGAAHTLQEMLTIKSDDLFGRQKAYQAILQGEEIPESTVPESFKLLVRELNGLSLEVEPIKE
jgi:DNA-directed RNA polymerase subunit beta